MKRANRRARPSGRRFVPPVAPPPLGYEQPILFVATKAVLSAVVTVGILHGLLRPVQPPNWMAVVFFLAFALIGGCMAYISGREVVVRFRRWRRRRSGIQRPEEDFTVRRLLITERSTIGVVGMFIVSPIVAGLSLQGFLILLAFQKGHEFTASEWVLQFGYGELLALGLMTALPATGYMELRRRYGSVAAKPYQDR
jgi:hypothetical protein